MGKGTSGAPATLQILHLEDNVHDAEILRNLLEDEGLACEVRRVETTLDFEVALKEGGWQLIISDYTLPSYDGLRALAFAQEKAPEVPFIFFSGTIGEETAIESLKHGATDYVLKHRPARLISAVRQALKDAEERKRRERIEAELRASEEQKQLLEAQFLRTQRMENIGSLVSGIAHDLNNTLVPVLMGVGFLRTEQLTDQARQILVTMEASAKRGADMVKQVLAFARGSEAKKAAVRVDLLICEMDKIVKDIFPKSIRWRVKISPDLWSVSGFATQLYQVLMNLCINARDAMPEGGRLELSAENIRLNEDQAKVRPEARPGPYLLITVSDTGTGMTPEILKNIFQPFFTTKEPGKGTGLGLSTSLNIVKNHGGFMVVKSDPGQGSLFSVYLPAAPIPEPAEVEYRRPTLPGGQGEWILVVDDEASICEITKATLENYGYRVWVAGGGPEAVAIFAEHREQIQLVLTDSSMPYMDGHATCKALRGLNATIRIIAVSGKDSSAPGDTSFHAKVDAFIEKPYTAEKLLTLVHQVLAGK